MSTQKKGQGITWTEETWNPLRGCSRVSEGCRNCYAEKMAARFCGPGQPYEGLVKNVGGEARWTGKMKLVESALYTPLRWKRPRKIFVNSMSDLFHESVPNEWIDRFFAVMTLARQHTFQVLTKRPARMHEYMTNPHRAIRVAEAIIDIDCRHKMISGGALLASLAPRQFETDPEIAIWPISNAWLGVSIEDQKTADERIPLLLATPAAKRFISAEPLLGAVNLINISLAQSESREREPCGLLGFNALTGLHWDAEDTIPGIYGFPDSRIDWVICGGESGANARPMHPDWARSLRDQCAAASVPFHFKQWGEWVSDLDRTKDDPDWRAPYSRFEQDNRYRFLNIEGGCGFHGVSLHVMRHAGKHAAGCLLDGVEHKEFPE